MIVGLQVNFYCGGLFGGIENGTFLHFEFEIKLLRFDRHTG